MSTTAFLDKLDLDQLLYAREEVQRRIDAKEQERRVCVWEVVESGFVIEYFEDYLAAAQCLHRRALELAPLLHLALEEKRLRLDCRFVIASEFREYVPEGHA